MRNVEIRKLKAEDVAALLALKASSLIGAEVLEEQAKSLENTLHAKSVFVDGNLIMCGGVTEYWSGRGEAWALFNPAGRKYFATIQKATITFFKECPIKRVEAAVACDFTIGRRWVETLGFTLDCERLKAFFPNGGDASLYSRIR